MMIGRCTSCDSISTQRVTTWGLGADISIVKKVEGKKPYLMQCNKCKRTWKTNGQYARIISGEYLQVRRAGE